MDNNLTTSADLLYLEPRGVTQLVATKDISVKFGMLRKLMVIPPHNMEMTINSPPGWGGAASFVLPVSTKHTLVRVVINIENNSISYEPDVEVVPPKIPLATKGTTEERPTAPELGARYYDTTLLETGKPISWNGASWVDSTGAVV